MSDICDMTCDLPITRDETWPEHVIKQRSATLHGPMMPLPSSNIDSASPSANIHATGMDVVRQPSLSIPGLSLAHIVLTVANTLRKLRDVRAVVFEKSNRVLQIRKVFACHDHIRQARHLPGSSCATEDRSRRGGSVTQSDGPIMTPS
jgi:hypothetical protein